MFFLALLYLAITVIGVFPFQGIPVVNVALGFPLGAIVAWRRLARSTEEHRVQATLRTVIAWALVTAGLTVIVCWVELLGSLLVLRFLGPAASIARWYPLLPPPTSQNPDLFRAQLFAMVIAPGIQILTTTFGGVLVLLFQRRDGAEVPRRNPSSEQG